MFQAFRMNSSCVILQVRAGTISSNDFKNGSFIEVDGAPYRVLGASIFVSVGKVQ